MGLIKKIFLIVNICILISCNNKKSNNGQQINIRKVEYQSSNDDYKYNISIPQFENIASADISNLNVALQENARIVIDNVSMDDDDIDETNLQRDAMISYDIKDNSFDILSIVLDTYIYQGDGNAIGYIESYNLSKKSLKLLEFRDIFVNKAEEYIEKYIKKATSQYTDMKVVSKVFQDDKRGVEIPFSEVDFKVKTAVLYFEDNDVVFVYPSYEIVGDPFKMIVFRVNKGEITEYIKKEM
ncbi:MAG: DUF4163 domain-containing protein [Fusobacteriaceae bacterium]|nr:DUF4163 domain-containing protein [Fusobacteriaceae bacterium]